MIVTVDRRRFLAGSAVSALGLVTWRQSAFAAQPMADTAFVNGRIWTGAGAAVYSDALAVKNGRIVAIGAPAVAASTGPATRTIDLDGAFVTPGMIDSHVHFTLASLQMDQLSLRDAANREEFVRRIADAASASAPGQWLMGGNWDNELWGGELPSRDWIDALTLESPVAVYRYDLHMVLLNSRALAELGIDETIAEIDGGVIGRDASGRLTGIFKDAAKNFVRNLIPPRSEAEMDAANARAMTLALSKGITQVCETGTDWRTLESARRMYEADRLSLRVYGMVPLADWERLNHIVATEGRGNEWVQWGGCKAVFDGSLGSRTALFYEHYLDDPATNGIFVTQPDDLREMMAAADAAGLHVATHAIGDRANDVALDIMAEVVAVNGSRDRRFRIEHAQHLRPESLTRFARQDVIASVQPYHAIDDGRWAIRRIGAERLQTSFAFQSLLENGARVCFGSDWPVAPLDPLATLEAAVLRQTLDGANPDGWIADQRVDLGSALIAHTRTAAYAGFREHDVGTLVPGKLADFVVWDADLTAIAPSTLSEVRVLQTWVGGVRAYG